MIIAGSNDHLKSRGLLARLPDGSVPSNEVTGEAMAEVQVAVRQGFTRNAVKIVYVLSPRSVCVHDGHYNSKGTIRCDHSRAEQIRQL